MSVKFKDLEAAIKFDHFNFVIFLEKEKKNKKCLCDMEFTSCFRFSFSNIEEKERKKKTYFYTPSVYIESERRK